MTRRSGSPDPRRSEAGRRAWAHRRGFTPEGLERLRQAALAGRPWEHSTGPRTVGGKASSAANGKARQAGPTSLRAELAEARHLIDQLRDGRKQLAGEGSEAPPSAVASEEEVHDGDETEAG